MLGLAAACLAAGVARAGPTAPPAQVHFLEMPGDPGGHYERFTKAFESQVLPRHPHARVSRRFVPVDDARATESVIASLVPRRGDVMVTAHADIARVATKRHPDRALLLLTLADPVVAGITDRALRPTANVSGYTFNAPFELKHLELLRDFDPGIRRIAVVADAIWASEPVSQRILAESPRLFGARVELLVVDEERELAGVLEPALARFDAFFVPDTPFNRMNAARIAGLLRKGGKPSIGGYNGHATAGGLMVYEPVRIEPWTPIAAMVGVVLSGVPAREIPMERPKRFRFLLNVAAARELGRQPPKSLLLRADEIVR